MRRSLWFTEAFPGAALFWSAFWLLLLASAACLIRRIRRPRPGFAANICLLVSSLLTLFLVVEIGLRLQQRVTGAIPLFTSFRVRFDDVLGWEGKRMFGDVASRRPKLLIIGDSYTHGLSVPDQQLYPCVLGHTLDAEVFAYGGSGYGTLQEYLVLDRYLDEIKPDLVILQVTSNDFINNEWDLAKASLINNNLAVRPFLIDGRIEYRYPAFLGGTRLFLCAHSRAINIIVTRVERLAAVLAARGLLRTVEMDIKRQRMGFDPFVAAVRTTEVLVERFKRRAGRVPIIAFTVDAQQPYLEAFEQIFARSGIQLVEDVERVLSQAEEKGEPVRLDGEHWNEAGHRIAGEALAGVLGDHGAMANRR